MVIDLVALTSFLAPILPFLLKGGEEAAQEVGKEISLDTWEKAKAIWGKLKPKIEALVLMGINKSYWIMAITRDYYQ